MKSTGVIRRIDELGRIVIPKEIRKNLNIREGENLEISVDNSNIILTKNSLLVNIEDIIKIITSNVSEVINDTIIVTNREKVISSSEKSYIDLDVSNFNSFIDNRETFISSELNNFKIGDIELTGYFMIVPLISFSDCLGLIIIYNREKINKDKELLIKFLAKIIVNKVDIS